MAKTGNLQQDSTQLSLQLKTVRYLEVDGIPMGVLDDGTPYLTSRGLAKLCGVAPSAIITFGANWDEEQNKPRGKKIASLLYEQGFSRDSLFIETSQGEKVVYAYTDEVCMAILEYYAFEAGKNINLTARRNYRILARQTLRTFIYGRLGYDPYNQIPDSWKHYHDRILLNDVPTGYFSVFREIADIVVSAIQQGLVVDTHTVPDISVGRIWSKFWENNELSKRYGERTKFKHTYPDYFPQSQADVEAYIYPLSSLGEFRMWLQKHYFPEKFPAYLKGKVKKGLFPASSVELLLDGVEAKEIEDGDDI